MSWYITARCGMSDEELTRRMKDIIRKDCFFKYLFEKYDISIDKIDDNLTFKIAKMHGRYAQSDSKTIFINAKLFEKGDFFENKVHFVVHEITHWLTKQKEKENYFTDPEEIDAFTHSMMYEILRGIDKKEIFRVFYPIVEAHFENGKNAKKLFSTLYFKANYKANRYKAQKAHQG